MAIDLTKNLVGGFNPSENMKVSWDDEIPNIWTSKKCSKPPTSVYIWNSQVNVYQMVNLRTINR
jgi:hypothetical protein